MIGLYIWVLCSIKHTCLSIAKNMIRWSAIIKYEHIWGKNENEFNTGEVMDIYSMKTLWYIAKIHGLYLSRAFISTKNQA